MGLNNSPDMPLLKIVISATSEMGTDQAFRGEPTRKTTMSLYHGLNKHIQIDPSFDREAIEKHTEQKIFPFFSHLRYSKRSIAEQIHDHQ